MRCCKVIPVYFGERRALYNGPTNVEEVIKMLKIHINFERKKDPGVDMDVILVHNINEGDDENPGIEFMRSLDGTPFSRGTFPLI